ncbi:MAG TPA: TIGR02996 domain-containing protein [Kofleriaceae bacterium]
MIGDELLRAVIENPDDEGARLVYVDSLIQAGDPRGELIANHTDSLPPTELSTLWQQTLGDTVTELTFERGFPTRATLSITPDDDRDPLLVLDRAPIRHVRLGYVGDDDDGEDDRDPVQAAERFARDPRTARLRSLDLASTQQRWGERAVRTLLSADLRALRMLEIGDEDATTYAVEAMLASTTPALQVLGFYGGYNLCNGDLRDGLAMLAASPRVATLSELAITKCSLEPSAADQIARSPHFANLVALDLTGGDYVSTQQLGDEGLDFLARSANLGKLERLELAGNEVTDHGVAALARSSTLGRLVRLGLAHNHVTDAGLAALAEPGVLAGLRSLTLTDCPITADGLAKLVAAHDFEELYLGGCETLGDAGMIALATSPHARKLRYLNLHFRGVGADGIRALVAAPIERLEFLVVPRLDPALYQLLVERFGAETLSGSQS